ncbi:phosphatase PAP2 family protein [Bacillus licheniformis]|nr:phosphatase PAP2 family protein [Bacillus licheniformis]
MARERPAINPLVHEPSYSFPSGHSMNAASMYPFIAFLLCSAFLFQNTVARFTCGRAFSSDSSESAACISAFIT